MKTLAHTLRNWRPGNLAKGTLVMTLGMGVRTLGQAAVFIIIARLLGVRDYGAYSAILALAMVFGWFVGMGVSGVMLRETARRPAAFAEGWGRTLAAILLTAPFALTGYALLARWLLPTGIHWSVILYLGLAEILFARITHAAMQAYQGHERMGRAARMHTIPVLMRAATIPLLMLWMFLHPTRAPLLLWAALYLFAAILAATHALWRLRLDFGIGRRPVWRGLWAAMQDGWPYALGSASGKVYMDIDKVMLARLASLDTTGIYATAHRFVEMAGIPLAALHGASTARFFRAGTQGIESTARYALRLLPVPMAYAAIIGTAFWLAADLVPWLLGPDYNEAADALRWLAWLPAFSVPRDLLHHAFIGADRQQVFVLVMSAGALINIALNLWAIPRWGWQGAAGATYLAELLMILLQLALLQRMHRKTVR